LPFQKLGFKVPFEMWTCAHICSLPNRVSNSRFENAHLIGHLLLLVWCKNKASFEF
jgi:hypothetical protein